MVVTVATSYYKFWLLYSCLTVLSPSTQLTACWKLYGKLLLQSFLVLKMTIESVCVC